MPDPYLLGIDLGTTTCRAALFDLDGHEVAAAYRELAVRYPRPRWAEIDPEEWWHATARVVRQALDRAAIDPARVAGVGLSGLMHAPVLLDAAGEPVAPSMLWLDQRCAPQAEALRRDFQARGLNPGYGASTGQSAPKLRWLAEVQPDVLARARRFMLPKDFIRFRLTGVDGTDPSDAGGTGLFDRTAGDWAWEIVELAKVPRALVPTVRPTAARAGGVTVDAARATGLVAGTTVAMGGADTFCTRLGVGGPGDGELCLYLGTAAWISQTGGAGRDGRLAIRHFGATSTTGAALRWTRDLFLGAEA
ncbi:MAG: FGGY family carbohydrate kinase, partial [Candidatus Dormibacteraceae bacterium]